MKKPIIFILIFCLHTSCIPTKIAPKFKHEDYKIIQAKKFKRKLPRETCFIFKDPKDADQFYYYINKKFQLNYKNVGLNTPFSIEGENFYLTYHETEKEDSNFNLLGLLVDAKLDDSNLPTVFNNYTKRKGHWYILISVYDEDIKNCLLKKHPMRIKVIAYLKQLKKEYLETQNYEELLLTKKS